MDATKCFQAQVDAIAVSTPDCLCVDKAGTFSRMNKHFLETSNSQVTDPREVSAKVMEFVCGDTFEADMKTSYKSNHIMIMTKYQGMNTGVETLRDRFIAKQEAFYEEAGHMCIVSRIIYYICNLIKIINYNQIIRRLDRASIKLTQLHTAATRKMEIGFDRALEASRGSSTGTIGPVREASVYIEAIPIVTIDARNVSELLINMYDRATVQNRVMQELRTYLINPYTLAAGGGRQSAAKLTIQGGEGLELRDTEDIKEFNRMVVDFFRTKFPNSHQRFETFFRNLMADNRLLDFESIIDIYKELNSLKPVTDASLNVLLDMFGYEEILSTDQYGDLKAFLLQRNLMITNGTSLSTRRDMWEFNHAVLRYIEFQDTRFDIYAVSEKRNLSERALNGREFAIFLARVLTRPKKQLTYEHAKTLLSDLGFYTQARHLQSQSSFNGPERRFEEMTDRLAQQLSKQLFRVQYPTVLVTSEERAIFNQILYGPVLGLDPDSLSEENRNGSKLISPQLFFMLAPHVQKVEEENRAQEAAAAAAKSVRSRATALWSRIRA